MDILFGVVQNSFVCLGQAQQSHHTVLLRGEKLSLAVSITQLLSVDFSFKAVWLLTVHQVLISGARDEPSSDHIRHGEAITVGPFLVMVCSPK